MVIVELLNINLPSNLAPDCSMENLDRQIAPIIKAPKLCLRHRSRQSGPGSGWPWRDASGGPASSAEGNASGDIGLGQAPLDHLGRLHARHVVWRKVAKDAMVTSGKIAKMLLQLVTFGTIPVNHLVQSIVDDEGRCGTQTLRRGHVGTGCSQRQASKAVDEASRN